MRREPCWSGAICACGFACHENRIDHPGMHFLSDGVRRRLALPTVGFEDRCPPAQPSILRPRR